MFTQTFVQTQIKENVQALRHWPFVRGIHRWPVGFPHQGPAARKMFPFDGVIMAKETMEIEEALSLHWSLLKMNTTSRKQMPLMEHVLIFRMQEHTTKH